MAYRFNGSTDVVNFSGAALVGKTFGAGTFAAFVKRSSTGAASNAPWGICDASNNNPMYWRFTASNALQFGGTGGFPSENTGIGWNSTTLWYLVVVTKATGTVIPTFHVHDGTSWRHLIGNATIPNYAAVASGAKLTVGQNINVGNFFPGDIVCVGIKNADSTDLQVETLSRTLFSSWTGFGFDWLAGFEASGTIVNRTTPGTGDETSRSGTSLVSDPPSWSWSTVSAPPVADFTGTPTSGTAPLSVTFTDASTNTPTSWLWDFGDGTTSTSQNPTHSYTSSGVYTVKLTATNAAGSNTKTRTAYISASEAIVYASGGGLDIY